MTDLFADVLNRNGSQHEAILEAMKATVAQASGMPRSGMLAEIDQALGEATAAELLTAFGTDPVALEEASGIILAMIWEEPDIGRVAHTVLSKPDNNLVISGAETIALMAVYGIIWLLFTRGRKKITKKTIRRPNGTIETTDVTEFTEFSDPMKRLLTSLSRAIPRDP